MKPAKLPAMSEADIQAEIFKQYDRRGAPNTVLCAIPNAGKRTARQGWHLKRQGMLPGMPDILGVKDGECYTMELKAENGRPSETQLVAISQLEKAGAYTSICYGLDAALRTLETWGLLVGQSTFVSLGVAANSVINKLDRSRRGTD